MDFLIVFGSLCFLMFVAYRGFSVIIFAPIAALGAVCCINPAAVAPVFSGVFMDSMVVFIKLYFPVFLLGAIFGKVIEISGFSKSIVTAVLGIIGKDQAILSIVIVGTILTYGGVSVYVIVFAIYPFAAELFKQVNIPKRLIPGSIALGCFTYAMDALPGTPQIQNIIPTSFFNTTAWAAPILSIIGSLLIFGVGLFYLETCRKRAAARGEGYGTNLRNEPSVYEDQKLPNPWLAIAPLFLVGIMNFMFTRLIPTWYEKFYSVDLPGLKTPVNLEVAKFTAIWAVEAALICGILMVFVLSYKVIIAKFTESTYAAVSGALLAGMNTASEYGYGSVIATLPGFLLINQAVTAIPDPLLQEAVAITSLSGITGSASGGMGIALGALADSFILQAEAAGIPLEVMHRVASMAAGGMDTLPHNGAIITLFAITGLSHRESYKDIFALTCIKTLAVPVLIGVYYMTGLV